MLFCYLYLWLVTTGAGPWSLDALIEKRKQHKISRDFEMTGAAVRTLDDVVSDLDLKSVDYLKLDVDGYEVQVLRGARNTLRRFGPVIFFEHAPYGVKEKGYDPGEIAEILTGAGYRFTDLKGRTLATGQYRLPEIKVGAGINLIAFPGDARSDRTQPNS